MLVTLYNSLVFRYLNYVLEVWGGAQDIHIKYRIIHKMHVPKHINDFFNVNADVHTYNTRHASLFRVPLTRTNLMKRTFRYIGVKIWNIISGSINHKVPIGSFEINLKNYIMYNYCMDIFEH